MERNGFTLVELIVVVAVVAILLGIGTLQFNQMTRKANIEAQTRMLYADVMTVRARALLRKRPQSVVFAANGFSVYSSNTVTMTISPILQRALKYPLIPGSGVQIDFDSAGTASSPTSGITLPAPVCVQANGNPGSPDTLIFDQTRVKMAKRNAGCTSNDVSTSGSFAVN